MIALSRKQQAAMWEAEYNPKVTQILYGGAAFGGKTFLGCYWQIFRRLTYPGTRGLLGRNELSNLKKTTLKTFSEVWNDYFSKITEETININLHDNVIYFSNGSEIVLMPLSYMPSDPDYTRLGSLAITDAYIDEGGEISEKAFNIVFSRIRHKLINNKPVLMIGSNPAQNWLKTGFVSTKDNKTIELPEHRKFIKAKIKDNPDKETADVYRKSLEVLPLYDRLRLLDGDWSVTENAAPFFYEYNSDKHLQGNLIIEDYEPLWISFDFNVKPTTAVLSQKIEGVGLFFYKEYQIIGGTEKLCQELKKYTIHPGGLKVTGDYSGNTSNTSSKVTDYQIIMDQLELTPFDLVSTTKANKTHSYSRTLCNTTFMRLPVFIDPEGCPVLVSELQNAQVKDPDSMKIELKKDRENFKMDAVDAFRYQINAWFPQGIKDIHYFYDNLYEKA